VLVNEIIAALGKRFAVTVETVRTAEERIAFNVPRELREAGAP
jgi:4-hydroxy-3-methylbut-2-enyl diphosphate reductase